MDMDEVRNFEFRENNAIMESIKTILEELGEDSNREGLKGTPYRWAKAAEEWFGGYGIDPKDVLNRAFTEKADMVIEGPISFFSHCEHHIAPFYGKIWIGYIPSGVVTGLDKMVKLVEIYSRRLQIQERLTSQIADAMMDCLQCKGVMVVCKAFHMCVSSRETKNASTKTITSAARGIFLDPKEGRTPKEEFLSLIKGDMDNV